MYIVGTCKFQDWINTILQPIFFYRWCNENLQVNSMVLLLFSLQLVHQHVSLPAQMDNVLTFEGSVTR